MSIRRPFPILTLFTTLTLVAATASAEPPVLRGGGHGGGSRGGSMGSLRVGPSGTVHGALRVAPRGGYAGFRGTVRALPMGYATYHHGGGDWYFHGGLWYRPWRGVYVGCYPPIGLCLDVLPFGFASCWYGGMRYYTYQDIYYTDAPTGGYAVAAPPEERSAAQPAPGSPDAAALDALLIAPKDGQSAEKMKADRLEAQRYALKQSGYDPAYSDPNDPGTPRARRAYLKAMRTFLEGRGYSVD
jgi:hypothetical protein